MLLLKVSDLALNDSRSLQLALLNTFAQGVDVLQEARFSLRNHRFFFEPTLSAATENQTAILVIRVGDLFNFNFECWLPSG